MATAQPKPKASAKLAAGTVLYRHVGELLEVLLVHPSGNYNRRAPWGIPKGQPDPGEALEAAARRETMEETGVICGDLVDLGFVDYTRSAKRVHGFAGRAPDGCQPRCASWEVDKAEFIELSRARRIIHPDQAAFLDRLEKLLAATN
jgi:predicted NUDIX family NTP pyrophosphohydrolase